MNDKQRGDMAHQAALAEQAERVYATAIAAEERRTAAWVADGDGDGDGDATALAAIEGGNGITIRNGNLTTVASMVGGVAQMEAFNAAGQSVGATPFPDTATLLDACRIIATLAAWQVVGGDEDDADRDPAADPACPMCHGTGVVYDTVDYGSTTAQMPSTCECVEDEDDADSANWEPVIDYEPRRVGW